MVESRFVRQFRGLGDAVGTCEAQASARIAPININIIDARDNWNPTGFYTPDQLGQALGFMMRMVEPMHDAIRNALVNELQLPGHVEQLKEAIDALDISIGVGNLAPDPLAKFSGAVAQAREQQNALGKEVIIEAQGFKRAVLNVLDAIKLATAQLEFIECMRPSGFFSVLSAVGRAADAFVNFLKAIGQVIKKVGDLVLKIPDLLGSFLTVLKFVPIVFVLLGGYYVGVKTNLIPTRYDPLKLRERQTFKPWLKKGSGVGSISKRRLADIDFDVEEAEARRRAIRQERENARRKFMRLPPVPGRGIAP